MILVFYNLENEVVEIVEGIKDPLVRDNDIKWAEGSITGAKHPFVLLEKGVEVNDLITEEILSQDLKGRYLEVDLYEENRRLREVNSMNSIAIMELAQIVLRG